MEEKKPDTGTDENIQAQEPKPAQEPKSAQDYGITFDDEEQKPNEQPPKAPINQESVDKRINELVFQRHEERRKREELEAKYEQLQERLNKQSRSSGDKNVTIPPLPDYYDDNYEAKIKERDTAIEEAAKLRAEHEYQRRLEAERQTKLMEQQQKRAMQRSDEMYKRAATDYGISADELKEAESRIVPFIKSPELADFILDRHDSSLIVKYLSQSATELEKISKMSPVTAAVYIESDIAKRAGGLKPNTSRAPEPIDIPKGNAAGIKESKFLKGVVLE